MTNVLMTLSKSKRAREKSTGEVMHVHEKHGSLPGKTGSFQFCLQKETADNECVFSAFK